VRIINFSIDDFVCLFWALRARESNILGPKWKFWGQKRLTEKNWLVAFHNISWFERLMWGCFPPVSNKINCDFNLKFSKPNLNLANPPQGPNTSIAIQSLLYEWRSSCSIAWKIEFLVGILIAKRWFQYWNLFWFLSVLIKPCVFQGILYVD